MCGIAGYFSPKGLFAPGSLERMTEAIAHRGPDAFGYFFSPSFSEKSDVPLLGMGHRRLSIIDLASRSNQPMHSHCGRYTIVYNGEVYNYTEIGDELKSEVPGFELRTTSDTEVILQAYVHWGKKSVEKLNGIFAFAIYDHHQEELFVCRDRVGVKPLFYSWDGINMSFASELKSLRTLTELQFKLNRAEIPHFLRFGFIPTPFTIYKNIFKLPAGSYVTISKAGFKWNKYWDIADNILTESLSDEKVAMEKLEGLITSAVKYQMISDVPSGVFLSGGIDSSLITAEMARLSTKKINTFSIGFKENRYDESRYAAQVAKHVGTDHHEYILSYKDAIELLDGLDDVYDEPFADSSAIPTMLVSKMARSNVTVTLSGEGGDELFFGYGSYQWARRLRNPLVRLLREPISAVLPYLPNRYRRTTELFRKVPERDLYGHIFSQEQYFFSDFELENILTPHPKSEDYNLSKQHFSRQLYYENYNKLIAQLRSARSLNPMEQQSLFDIYCYLQDDLLVKVDRASMKFALEVRVPYLDHRIIEFALNLSPSLKYKNGVAKYLLKEVLYKQIPRSIFDRPKQGFAIPLQSWMEGELRFLIDDNLNEQVIKKYEVIKYSHVQELIQRFRNGDLFIYNRLWLLIVLHKWLRKNFA